METCCIKLSFLLTVLVSLLLLFISQRGDQRYRSVICYLPSGVNVMCHPGTSVSLKMQVCFANVWLELMEPGSC